MFVDRTRVFARGGAGGNGCTSFRREKFVPKGGPDGGDGGDGGDVVFVVDDGLNSLQYIKHHPHWIGERGQHGMGRDRHGRNSPVVEIKVPCGTLIKDHDTETTLRDLKEPGERFMAAKGGRGGKGNARFKTSQNNAPRFSEIGEPGEEKDYILELKLIAEIGLVGLPNAGKSTFLSAVTRANPKIAPYPFTTISPNLGIANLSDYRSMTIADIPGIIEGAAEGKGLGHDFLRHIERTKVLLFIIDLGDEDCVATLDTLKAELAQHSVVFKTRPSVIAFNKIDVTENQKRFDELKEQFPGAFAISAMTHDGIDPLLEHLWTLVEQVRREEAGAITVAEPAEYTYDAPYTIEPEGDGFAIDGQKVLRAVRMTDFSNEEAVCHLQHRLKKMGIMNALKRLGARAGATIRIGEVELEYHPD
jgi:GTPase